MSFIEGQRVKLESVDPRHSKNLKEKLGRTGIIKTVYKDGWYQVQFLQAPFGHVRFMIKEKYLKELV